jgi:predicted DNA-binding transcriptional regulator YafY
MLELLQANHHLTGRALADKLGVEERTVRRYAGRLAELGIPVQADRGRYGGYRLMPGFKLPPLMLTDDEATESALAKVGRVLPVALRDRVRALRETLGFTLATREGTAPAASVVLALAVAAHDRRRVRLRYRSWKGTETERDLDPYGLVFHSGRWYVTGHDHRSGEVRTFRVDRVLGLEERPESYDVPGGLDPVRQVMQSLAAVPYAHDVEVLLETGLAEARLRIPPTTATLTETGGGVLMTTRAERLDGMAQMLAGLGWPFQIRRTGSERTSAGPGGPVTHLWGSSNVAVRTPATAARFPRSVGQHGDVRRTGTRPCTPEAAAT